VPPATPYTITGGTWPAQIWSRFASSALTGSFAVLRGAETGETVEVEIDLSTGFLAGPLCPRQQVARIQVPADSVPTVICPIHNPSEIVSVGAVDVPLVINLALGDAVSALAEVGLQTTVDYQDGGNLARNTVFNQVPSPGFPAQNGTIVRLVVAGPAPGSTVPSLLGFPGGQAEVELADIGVGAEIVVLAESDPEDAARRPGVVWKQDPAPGADDTGSVTLWVNP
ncbi:MAG TPA: PASTA domain-containing protein, partial [Actinobacteria bacterium]|nr:PASTA domain-containing protein [Actinomycetota bacterium]